MKVLRPLQQSAIEAARASFKRGNKRVVLQAPTGFGKTVLAANMIFGALAKGKRIAFVVDSVTLVDQTVERFFEDGIRDVGVMQADHPMTDPSKPVQICTAQTLLRRECPDVDVVFVDECHERHEAIWRWMEECPDLPFLGMSATPWSKGLGLKYEDLTIACTTQQLIDEGWLCPFRTYAAAHPDLTGVKTRAGEYATDELSEVMANGGLIADIVTTWQKLGEGRPTIAFCVDRAHAKKAQARFEANGIPWGYIDAFTDRLERKEIEQQLNRGEIKGVASVDCLTKGVDWSIGCLIIARPTKSKIKWVQAIGRGLRINPEAGPDCLARDTLVLTDKGVVKIQDITLDHKVWDGVEFVGHGGAVCKGIQQVIRHDGIVATPDHKVMTDEGWLSLETAKACGKRVARTGNGGKAIRLSDSCFARDEEWGVQFAGLSFLRSLRGRALGALSQYQEAARHQGLPSLQWKKASHGTQVAVPALSGAKRPVHEPEQHRLRALRRFWNTLSVCGRELRSALDRGEFGRSRSVFGAGPYKQPGPLRAWQPSLGNSDPEHTEQFACEAPNSFRDNSERKPSYSVFRQSLVQASAKGVVGCRDSVATRQLFEDEAGFSTQVWDIINAGPLQRFTANGRLVHNCIILDHAGNTLRLGFVTDIHITELDKSEKGKGETPAIPAPLPKECPKCSFIKPPKMRECPACKFVPEIQSDIEEHDGELVQVGGASAKPKKPEATREEKQVWYSSLRTIAREKGYSDGWVSNQYRDRFKVWPKGLDGVPIEPPAHVRSWVKSRQIAYAKRRRAA